LKKDLDDLSFRAPARVCGADSLSYRRSFAHLRNDREFFNGHERKEKATPNERLLAS
jgi:hypothetical protein